MNKWKKVFLIGFPVMPAPARLPELPDDHPDVVLWAKIAAESNRRNEDVADLIPRLLQEALGERALARAQRADREALDHTEEAFFICYRAALMACYHHTPRCVPSDLQVSRQIHQLLLTPSEREEAKQARRWKTLLRTATPYNRLPC
ncbi:MAG: hypothetical protein OEL20_05345 [Sulfuritalea sp.]|nr:hypothetical protein [Sulfuritalea sp.]